MDSEAIKLKRIEQLKDIESEQSLNNLKNFKQAEAGVYPFSEEHRQVLDARLKQHNANPDEGISWSELKKRLKN